MMKKKQQHPPSPSSRTAHLHEILPRLVQQANLLSFSVCLSSLVVTIVALRAVFVKDKDTSFRREVAAAREDLLPANYHIIKALVGPQRSHWSVTHTGHYHNHRHCRIIITLRGKYNHSSITVCRTTNQLEALKKKKESPKNSNILSLRRRREFESRRSLLA